MTRASLILIIIFVVLGVLGFQYFYSHHATVVYSLRDIPAGEKLAAEDVEERFIVPSKIPSHAIVKKEGGVGRKLKYAVEKGQLLSHWDFEPIPRKAIVWAKSIGKNQNVTEKHLKHVWIEDDPVPHRDLLRIKSFIGKQVKKNVQAETFLRMDQFSE